MLSGGRIFSRETHRIRPLSGILQDLRFEHVEMFLDDVLVEDPTKRIKFTDLAPRLERLRTLVRGDFAPLKTSTRVRCRFCGIGTYETFAKSGPSGTQPLARVGLQNSSGSDLRILRCAHCGHVETFEFSNIAAKDWWAK